MSEESALAASATKPGEKDAAGSPAAAIPFAMWSVGKHATVYAIGIILSRLVSFLMLPLYTRHLTPADYGVMALIEMSLDFVSIMAGAQLALGVFRYYHKTASEVERGAVVSTALIGLAISYTAGATLAFVGAPLLAQLLFGSTEHAPLIRIAAGSLALQSGIVVPLAYARVTERSLLFVAANLGRLVVSVSLAVLFLVGFGWGLRGVFLATLGANASIALVLLVWVLRRVGIRMSKEALTSLLRYGLPLMVTQFAAFTLTFGDRYFLQRSAGEAVVGLYNLSYMFGFILAIIGFTPFEQVWGPKRFEIARRADRDLILSRGFRYMNLVLLTAAVGIALFVGDVLRVMTTPLFYQAAEIVPLILLAYILQSWSMTQDIGVLVSERTLLITAATWSAAGVALVGYALLIPRFHAWGAAAATVVAFAVRYFLTYYFAQRLFPIRYDWLPVLRLCGLGLLAVIASLALPVLPLILSILAHAAILSGYVICAWLVGILTATERDQVRQLLTRTLNAVRASSRVLPGSRTRRADASQAM
jgi:O-antigen/teichoic acid export membrane protein